jgi:pilus assembly protein Flp/PilA
MMARSRREHLIVKDQGASAVEYGLLVAAIAAVLVTIVFGLGAIISTEFQKTSDCIVNSAQPTAYCSPATAP